MKPNLHDIQTTISAIISRELKLESQAITTENNLRDIPGMESLKILRIILCIEEHYGIELEENIVFSVNTIDEIAIAVATLLEPDTLQYAWSEQYA